MSLLTSRALMAQCSILERSDITGYVTPALQMYLRQCEAVDKLQKYESASPELCCRGEITYGTYLQSAKMLQHNSVL